MTMVRGISAARRRARPGKAVLILAVAIGVVVLAGLYGRIMGYDLRRELRHFPIQTPCP